MTSGRYRDLLDVVIASDDFPPVDVTVDQSGLSEHKLAGSMDNSGRQSPASVKTILRRSWKSFNQEQLNVQLKASQLVNQLTRTNQYLNLQNVTIRLLLTFWMNLLQ